LQENWVGIESGKFEVALLFEKATWPENDRPAEHASNEPTEDDRESSDGLFVVCNSWAIQVQSGKSPFGRP
jgi:hypothetical protein